MSAPKAPAAAGHGRAKTKAKAKAKSATDKLLERRAERERREKIPEFDKILNDPNNWVINPMTQTLLSADQIIAMNPTTEESKIIPGLQQVMPQKGGLRTRAFKGLPKEVRALLSEETLSQVGISVETLKLLTPYMTGQVLDKQELTFLTRIWRTLEAAYWQGHIGGRVGLEISNCWSCLRSKMCVDAFKGTHMYVIIPVGRRGEAARREIDAPEYCDRITIVHGYSSTVKLPKNVKVDFIVFEPPQNVQAGGSWNNEDVLVLETAKQRFLTDPRLPGAAIFI